jgi:HEAT repeat protein
VRWLDVQRSEIRLQWAGGRNNVQGLLRFLDEERPHAAWDNYIRSYRAINALVRIGDQRAIPGLRTVMRSHPDERIRARAASALASLGDRQGYHETAALADGGHREAIQALGVIGDERAVPLLRRAVAEPSKSSNDDGIGRVRAASKALETFGDIEGLLLGLEAQDGDLRSHEREIILESIARLGDPTALATLERLALDDPDATVRAQAAHARLKTKDAAAPQPRKGTTPARCAHVRRLLANGWLTEVQVAELIIDDRVSDASWAKVRDLSP